MRSGNKNSWQLYTLLAASVVELCTIPVLAYKYVKHKKSTELMKSADKADLNIEEKSE